MKTAWQPADLNRPAWCLPRWKNSLVKKALLVTASTWTLWNTYFFLLQLLQVKLWNLFAFPASPGRALLTIMGMKYFCRQPCCIWTPTPFKQFSIIFCLSVRPGAIDIWMSVAYCTQDSQNFLCDFPLISILLLEKEGGEVVFLWDKINNSTTQPPGEEIFFFILRNFSIFTCPWFP